MSNHGWLQKISSKVGWYISGFTDGEGSFNVSLKKVDDHRLGWKVAPSFNVSQRDSSNLELIKETLGVGNIRERKDGVTYYEVRNYSHIYEKVIPFFDKFSFQARLKEKNFEVFKKIIYLMNKGKHLTKDGLLKIVRLRESLNKGRGRKRKYTIDDVFH